MSKHTFEDFLMEKHADQYIGTKDCMVDDFNDWVQDLGIDEIIKYGDKFQKQINAELLEACKKGLDYIKKGYLTDTSFDTQKFIKQAIAKAEGVNQCPKP